MTGSKELLENEKLFEDANDIVFEMQREERADEVVHHWAMIESAIKQAKEDAKLNVLEKHGMSKDGFKQLADNVVSIIKRDEIVETPYGKVQLIADKPITVTRASLRDGSPERRRLVLVNK